MDLEGSIADGWFYLQYGQWVTRRINWTDNDAHLVSAIQAALDEIPEIGRGNTVVSADTGSSGIGTYLITFGGALANQLVGDITVFSSSLTKIPNGTTPTVTMTVTTAGITGSLHGMPPGTKLFEPAGPREWINVGSAIAPDLVRTGPLMAVVALAGVEATTGGAVGAWTPTHGGNLIVLRCAVNITTKSTGVATLDVGTAADAVTSSDNLLDGIDVSTSAALFDNGTNGGTNGKTRQLLTAGQSVTFTGSADTTGLVGTAYIEYLPV